MVGISLLLMPAYGIYGAVIADIIGQLVSTSLNFIFSNRLKKIHWSLKPVLFSISGFLMLWLLTIVFAFPNPWLDILYRTLLLGLFFTFILLGLDRGEIIRNVLASIRKNTDQFDQQVHDIESQVE
jgi:O-antigen/teichoic acid export membrane protein